MDGSGPVEVWTEGDPFRPPTYEKPTPRGPGEEACGKPKLLYRYADGVILKLDNGPSGGAIFIGDKGRISIDRGTYDCSLDQDPAGTPKKGRRPDANENHIGNWFESMRSRKLPAADVEIGHRSVTVCHLGNIARWLGRRLKWDPATETFPGDDEANAHLDRPRRKGHELPAL